MLLPFAWIHYWVLAMVLLVAVVRSARLRRLGRLSVVMLAVAYTAVDAG